MIEHDMRIVMDISDRVHVLNFGRKIAEGTPDEVKAHPDVLAAYLGSSSTKPENPGVAADRTMADVGG